MLMTKLYISQKLYSMYFFLLGLGYSTMPPCTLLSISMHVRKE